ncbi:6-phosphogluconolactonase [Halopseudomonas salina]|uniref:6-phosphogluconolactonase n=1 Tax=Halopseudomonas salina TaxID=1323744 RepID=A0ABQ1PJU0_9GAMM|nr:6-phosphogluconolactonase [Halopseudomonas salina]GGC98481.1 6-phosphogluconolactonase [Halopseudomonas salina]
MSLQTLAAERGLQLTVASNPQSMAWTLSRHIADALADAIGQRGIARLAVSGGRSPEAFLRCLDEQPVDWAQVAITLVDERWVPESDAASNAGMLRRCMPSALAKATWLPLFRGASPSLDASLVEQAIAPWLPLDVVVLGMGNDGHCASLFPGQDNLEKLLSTGGKVLCAPSQAPDLSPRITLTGAVLRTARLQLLAISGEDKNATLCRAFSAPTEQMPVAAFLTPPLQVFYSSDY